MGKVKHKQNSNAGISFFFKKIEISEETPINVPDGFDSSNISDIKYQLRLSYINEKNGEIFVNVKYSLFHDGQMLFSFGTKSEFSVSGKDALVLADSDSEEDLVKRLAALSIDLSRGLQATLTNGTPLEMFYIPFKNPKEYKMSKTSGTTHVLA